MDILSFILSKKQKTEAKEQVQTDWEQNDETAVDYIKNRPFYTADPVETTLVDDVEVVNKQLDVGTINIELVEGGAYKVTINGTEYELVANKYNLSETDQTLYIGDPALFEYLGGGKPVGLCNPPFLYTYLNQVGFGIFVYYSDDDPYGGTCRVTILGPYAETIKIPYKYMAYASNDNSYAEAFNNKEINVATGSASHAEGYHTTATGIISHAEGNGTTASGGGSHAEGQETEAVGDRSHAEGKSTIASGESQHVQGKYNIEDTDNKYAHIVGNGTKNIKRSNAHTLDWAGNGWFAGNLYVGGTGQDDENAKKLATEEYVTNSLPTTLPNPNALTIKQGDTEVSYDGSGAVTVTIPESSGGKSAYQYAVEGGYTGTETEFAAKLAAELPDALPNPNALTFTGAVSAIYDGSAPCSVDIPSGGGDGVLKYYNMDITDLASGTIPSGTEPSYAHTGITFGQLNEYSRIRITINNPTTNPAADWAITQGTDTTAWKRIGLTKNRGYLELVKVANHCWEARSLSNKNVGAVKWGGSPHDPYLVDNTGTVLIGSILNFSTIQDSEICIYNISKLSADTNWFIHGLN